MAVFTKKCNQCTIVKLINCFGKHKITKDGCRGICKSCNALNTRKFYESNKSEILKKIKKSRQKNPTPWLLKVDHKEKTKKDIKGVS